MRNGRKGGRSLSFLEGFGGAYGLPVWVEDIVEAGALSLNIDNRVTDALSKGNMKEVETEMPEAVDDSEKRSKVLER